MLQFKPDHLYQINKFYLLSKHNNLLQNGKIYCENKRWICFHFAVIHCYRICISTRLREHWLSAHIGERGIKTIRLYWKSAQKYMKGKCWIEHLTRQKLPPSDLCRCHGTGLLSSDGFTSSTESWEAFWAFFRLVSAVDERLRLAIPTSGERES